MHKRKAHGALAFTLLAAMATFSMAMPATAAPTSPSLASVPDSTIDSLLRRASPSYSSPDQLTTPSDSKARRVPIYVARSTGTDLVTQIPQDSGIPVSISSGGNLVATLRLPKLLGDGKVIDANRVAFRSATEEILYTVESVEGATRIHNLIGNRNAPHSSSYEIALPPGTSHHQYPDGSIVFRDSHGTMIAGIAPPWASDANGKALKTAFTFDGKILTQDVDVSDSNIKYPVVADPYMGKYLFYDLNTRSRWNGQPVYSGTKTSWGQAVHNGSYVDPAGWVGGVVAGQFIMRNEGWQEWVRKWGSRVTSRATFYQQYSCHVLGGFYNWAGDWNLEAARSDNAWWATTAVFHRCNW